MTFLELISKPIFSSPRAYTSSDYFDFLKKEFKKLNKAVAEIEDFTQDVDELFVDIDFVKRNYKKFIAGILETIKIYYNGSPSKAYEKLNETVNNNGKNFGEILRRKNYKEQDRLYRIRINKNSTPYSKDELFHIPFQLRTIIPTQRYSIPGYPSLYMGTNTYVCWEELGRPNINEFQVVEFKCKKEISYLDLSSFSLSYIKKEITKNNNRIPKEIYDYFMTFPLVLACSIKVKNRNGAFKPEYIIPQLLLQWVKENEQVDGIKYTTTHLDINNDNFHGEFSNLVFPVKENKQNGYCSKLKNMFASSEVISWQLLQLIHGNNLGTPPRRTILAGAPTIELINGKSDQYDKTIFGQLEYYFHK